MYSLTKTKVNNRKIPQKKSQNVKPNIYNLCGGQRGSLKGN